MCRLVQKCELKFKPTAQKPIEYKYGPRSVAIGDFDNDTCLDMVIAYHAVNKIGVYLGYGNGNFKSPITYSTGSYSSPYMVTVDDIDNDSHLDIAVANFGTNNVAIFYGFGNGSFCGTDEYTDGTNYCSHDASDHNHDTSDHKVGTSEHSHGPGNHKDDSNDNSNDRNDYSHGRIDHKDDTNDRNHGTNDDIDGTGDHTNGANDHSHGRSDHNDGTN
ncbi:unnamed protein product [Rotaria sp. Silwood1]|nr:unnamed protein product [Rotaria sp. Silwood1]